MRCFATTFPEFAMTRCGICLLLLMLGISLSPIYFATNSVGRVVIVSALGFPPPSHLIYNPLSFPILKS